MIRRRSTSLLSAQPGSAASLTISSVIGRALPCSGSYHELKIWRKIHCVQR